MNTREKGRKGICMDSQNGSAIYREIPPIPKTHTVIVTKGTQAKCLNGI